MIKPERLTEALEGHQFLRGFRPEHIEMLARLAMEVSIDQDEILFREGEVSSYFYLVITGSVALHVVSEEHTYLICTVRDGEELGWSSVLDRTAKHFEARALTNVRALAFEGKSLRDACDQDPEFGYVLMRRLFEVVVSRLDAVRFQLAEDYFSSASFAG